MGIKGRDHPKMAEVSRRLQRSVPYEQALPEDPDIAHHLLHRSSAV